MRISAQARVRATLSIRLLVATIEVMRVAAYRSTGSALHRLDTLEARSPTISTAGRRAFFRIVRVTQRHTVDRHHLEANRAVGSFHPGLAARRGRMLADVTIQRLDNVAI